LYHLTVNETIASSSINAPLQNIEKLFIEVAGSPDGAAKSQPLLNVTSSWRFTNVPNCLYVSI
jgi:hypothetical protein